MVPTEAVINFKFKNALDSDIQKFSFSGASISVKELKLFISQKHKLDQKSSRPDKTQAPSELALQNVDTGERKKKLLWDFELYLPCFYL